VTVGPSRALGGALAIGLSAALALSGCGSKPAPFKPDRATPPLSLLQEYTALQGNPAPALQTMRSLGVGALRMFVEWKFLAADPNARSRPARNPYPASAFAWYDRIDRDAQADGIELDFLLSSAAPRWAVGRGAPRNDQFPGAWSPSPTEFRRFVETLGKRYSGHYTPPGASSPLPRVHFWEIWSEPNWGPSLEPQFSVNPTRPRSPAEYRSLVDGAWSALARTGHARDTVVIGNLSPRGTPGPPPSAYAARAWNTSPLAFTRELYCVDSSYRPLQGKAALQNACPTTAAGARGFPREHPGLFQVPGYGVHPYPINLPPTHSDTTNQDTVEFSQIPNLVSALDRIQRAYDSHRQIDVYNTEYGYITNPPNTGTQYLPPAKAAIYLNWAEYLTWRNPRIANSMQFGLYDQRINRSVFGPGGFASALIAYTGKPKATFYAYRMPIFMPTTRANHGQSLELWGCARPAPYAYDDTHRPQYVQIQFRSRPGRQFKTIRTVRLTAAGGCYFDVAVAFPSSGTVRLQWSYPRGDHRLLDPAAPSQTAIHSRSVQITIH
jgi:hypothetical protein